MFSKIPDLIALKFPEGTCRVFKGTHTSDAILAPPEFIIGLIPSSVECCDTNILLLPINEFPFCVPVPPCLNLLASKN